MLGPARTTRAYRVVRRTVVAFFALFVAAVGWVEYALAMSRWGGDVPYRQWVALGGAVSVTVWGWMYLILLAGVYRPYRWLRITGMAVFAAGIGVFVISHAYGIVHNGVIAVAVAAVVAPVAARFSDRKMLEVMRG